MYTKGDIVRCWSLQSFNGGGFLNGVKAVVRQDQTTADGSVLIIIPRNLSSVIQRCGKEIPSECLDSSYECYAMQLALVNSATEQSRKNVDEFLRKNALIRQYEHERKMEKNISRETTPYHYAPEFYFDENMNIKLDASRLEFPEMVI